MAGAVPLDDLPVTAARSLPYNSPTLDLHAAKVEEQYGLPAGILRAIKNDGEKSNANQVSPKGARGVMQFMPDTAKEYGLQDPTDPVAALDAAARYLVKAQKVTGSSDPAILAAAYNGGMNRQVLRQGQVPNIPETKAYAGRVQSGVAKYAPAASSRVVPADDLPDAEPAAKPKPAEKPSGGYLADRLGEARDMVAGAVRGAGSIGATIIDNLGRPVQSATPEAMRPAVTAGLRDRPQGEALRSEMDAGLRSLGADTDSTAFAGGKVGTEILGTAGVGGAIAAPLRMVAPRLASAIASSGFRTGGPVATGLAEKAADLGIRAAGGGVTGATTAAMVDPKDTGTGAIIGSVLPPAVALAGKVAQATGAAVRSVRTPNDVVMANKLRELTGMPQQELVNALNIQGPSMIPGYQQTVPQILQDPAISQLQRTVKTAGSTALGEAEKLQQAQMRQALERVAPIDNTVNDAADRAGGAISGYALPARAEAGKRVNAAFEAVDPFGETALHLPVEKMQGAVDKYLGPGTFGTGGKAREAVKMAESVGTEPLEAIAATKAGRDQTLLDAVKRAGINPNALSSKQFGGELRDLRQSKGMGRLTNRNGQSLERVAEDMHQRGYLPDEDPATLLNALREGGGQTLPGAGESGMRAQLERSMGDLPEAGRISKAVPFQTVQNLRSSIGEAAETASAKGANKEAAALRQMVSEIDSRVNRAAGGSAAPDEFFPKDIADQYRTALDLHAKKMQQFETGPQTGMFRKGGDGQASIQGAEIPPKFYSGRASQVEDVQSFKRLIGDREDLAREMKRYALTEGASTSNQAGDLTSKFVKWMESRSGANRELFNPQELATIGEVGKAVERSIGAESAGRVTGSDTAQKLASMQSLGMLDNKLVDFLANRIPVLKNFSGPVLSGLRETAGRDRNKLLGELLADPSKLAAALDRMPAKQRNKLLDAAIERAAPAAYRVAPVMGVQ